MTTDVDRQQQKAKEFMGLLPLTLALAGLPECDAMRPFSDGQLEARATAIRNAYKVARQIIVDVTK